MVRKPRFKLYGNDVRALQGNVYKRLPPGVNVGISLRRPETTLISPWLIVSRSYTKNHTFRIYWLSLPQASDFPKTWPLKVGHAGTTIGISHLLPNFILVLDALTNTYLGLRKSKDGDKAEPIIYFFKFKYVYFSF